MKLRKIKNLILFFLLAACTITNAQIVVTGKITDAVSNEPLIGAYVSIKNLEVATTTDAEGAYTLVAPIPKKKSIYVVTASYLGYKDKVKAVESSPILIKENVTINFGLEVDPLTLKDVIVTANRVDEELQDVPVAATVVNAVNLRKRTVSNTEEALASVPNLVTDAYLPSRATFSIRGLSSDFENLGIENSIGLYIDDVYYSRSYSFNQSLMDIERVEVLRGPQGTLFGKSTIGGVLHVISEEPKMANFAAIEFNAGNFNYIQTRVKGNVELIKDKMALRVNGAFRKRDGWMIEENIKAADENGVLFYGGRIALLYKPTEKLDISLKSSWTADDRADFTVDYKVPDDGFNRLPIDSTEMNQFDRRINQNEEGIFFNRNTYSLVGKAKYKLDDLHTITSVTAYTGSSGAFIRDFDATSANGAVFGKRSTLRSFSQEINIARPRENSELFYVGGIFFQRESFDLLDTIAAKEAMVPIFGAVFGNPGVDIPNYLETSYNTSIINSTSFAVYGSSSYEISPGIRVNAGLRYSIERKDIEYWQICNCPVGFLSTLVAPTLGSDKAPIIRDASNNFVSGNLGVDFRTTDRILLYLNYSKGFKAAGFNAGLTPDSRQETAAFVFDPEYVNSYEFGIKIKTYNRFKFNAAAFVTDFRNKQETVSAGNSIIVRNADKVQGQGIEAEFTAIWSKHFKTEAALGALNLRYQDFPFVDPFTFEEINLSGNRTIKAPGFTFKLSPEIFFPMGRELKFMMRFDLNHIGKSFNDIYNTEGIARQASSVINGRLSISTKNEKFGLAIWGKNLTEATYIQHGWTFIFGDHVSINPPRMIGVEFRANIY